MRSPCLLDVPRRQGDIILSIIMYYPAESYRLNRHTDRIIQDIVDRMMDRMMCKPLPAARTFLTFFICCCLMNCGVEKKKRGGRKSKARLERGSLEYVLSHW